MAKSIAGIRRMMMRPDRYGHSRGGAIGDLLYQTTHQLLRFGVNVLNFAKY